MVTVVYSEDMVLLDFQEPGLHIKFKGYLDTLKCLRFKE